MSRRSTWPLLLIGLVGSCSGGDKQDPLLQAWTPNATHDPVVARVAGSPIFASEVRDRQRQRDGGAVLDDLILEDLLAAEARRQGLLADPGVRSAGHKAMVQGLLAEDFEKAITPADIPMRLIERAYDQNHWFFNRPEIREFEHLVAMLPLGKPPARERAVEKFAREIQAAASAPGAPPLAKLRLRFLPRARELKIELRYEKAPGVRRRLEKPFGDLLWALPEGKLGGKIVRSRYGWHILRHLKRRPAVSRPLQEVVAQVRKNLWPQYRQMRFKTWLQELRARDGAKVEKTATTLFRRPRKRPSPGETK